MLKKLSMSIMLAAATLGVADTAQAVSLNSGQFTSFSFGGVGSTSSSFDFSVGADGADLRVTDAGFAGDIFQVSNFGTVIGTTSSVSTNDDIFESNGRAGFRNPLFSSGIFSLNEGDQSITISPTASPFDSGTGFIRFDPKGVPEPLTILGSMAAIGMGAMLKREYSRKKYSIK